MRAYLEARDGRVCGRCSDPIPSSETASIGHVLALALGGTDALANLRLEHLVCNMRAGADGGVFSISSELRRRVLLRRTVPEIGRSRTIIRYTGPSREMASDAE